MNFPPAQRSEGLLALTPIEKDIVLLICEGRSSSEIAKQLFKSPRTIEGYRRSILEKTNSRNVAGIIFYAIEHGLVSLKTKVA